MLSLYENRKAEFATLIAQARIKPARQVEIDQACAGVLRHRDLFEEAAAATTVPVAVLMALSIREMSGRTDCYLGNGQRLSMRTTIVPKGRGPFVGEHAFRDGCIDACRLDGLDKVAATIGWSATSACFFFEEFNGDGYRRHDVPTPYVFGATTVQQPGKFTSDHHFAFVMDGQLGTLPIIETLAANDAALALPGLPDVKADPVHVEITPQHGPDIKTLQSLLNRLEVDGTPLAIDGSFGRRTRFALNTWRKSKGLPDIWSPDISTINGMIADSDARGV